MRSANRSNNRSYTIEPITRTNIGKFHIRKLIGRGATASVYLANDPFSDSDVAIKIAHQNALSDPETGKRLKRMFLNEASLAGELHHPYIVPVYDAGTENDMHYIVMEYIPGHTLKEYCKPENLLPINDVVEIIFKCANALEYAYRQGLIHRDIKPANLLITDGTNVKISDFGTALLADTELTQIMDAVGTPSYMSPEQIKGRKLTEQADIYSLGIVMYQLLSGELPFNATNQYELIQKISRTPPTPLASVRSGIPEEVIRIVNRCISRTTAGRYPDWPELTADLAKIHEQLEHTAAVDASDTRKFNTLKTLAFFHDFTDVELWEILRISKWRSFKGRKTLLQEGKIGGSVYIVASGEARIMKNDALLDLIEPGHCFGEMAYIHGKRKARSASVVSNGDITIIKIKTEALQQATDQLQTKFNLVLLKTLADRLEKTSLMASAL